MVCFYIDNKGRQQQVCTSVDEAKNVDPAAGLSDQVIEVGEGVGDAANAFFHLPEDVVNYVSGTDEYFGQRRNILEYFGSDLNWTDKNPLVRTMDATNQFVYGGADLMTGHLLNQTFNNWLDMNVKYFIQAPDTVRGVTADLAIGAAGLVAGAVKARGATGVPKVEDPCPKIHHEKLTSEVARESTTDLTGTGELLGKTMDMDTLSDKWALRLEDAWSPEEVVDMVAKLEKEVEGNPEFVRVVAGSLECANPNMELILDVLSKIIERDPEAFKYLLDQYQVEDLALEVMSVSDNQGILGLRQMLDKSAMKHPEYAEQMKAYGYDVPTDKLILESLSDEWGYRLEDAWSPEEAVDMVAKLEKVAADSPAIVAIITQSLLETGSNGRPLINALSRIVYKNPDSFRYLLDAYKNYEELSDMCSFDGNQNNMHSVRQLMKDLAFRYPDIASKMRQAGLDV